jgi:ADP-ribose pyrophosphatase
VKFRVRRAREIFQGRVLRLVLRDVDLPNGRRATLQVVEHPGAVAILPVFDDGDVLLIRQFRPSIGRELYEIPAGTLEPGERPLATARREIVEETGYRAERWQKLAEFYTAPGFCTELMHLFVARDLSPARAPGDADEIIRTARMPLARALELARRGRVRDAKSLVGLLWYAHEQRG